MEPTPRLPYVCPHCLSQDTAKLLALRDALNLLSLALKDLLFELDVPRRASAQQAVNRLLKDMAAPPRS